MNEKYVDIQYIFWADVPPSPEWSLTVNGTEFWIGETVSIDACAGMRGGFLEVRKPDGKLLDIKPVASERCEKYIYVVPADVAAGTYTARLLKIDLSLVLTKTYIVHTELPAEPPILPPPPVLTDCTFPVLSWNLISVLSDLIAWIGCKLENMQKQIGWIIDTLGALIPQLVTFLVYIISLKWISDFLNDFFRDLDVYLSKKFDVKVDEPFFDQIMQKMIDWLLAPLNDAAKTRIKEKKW